MVAPGDEGGHTRDMTGPGDIAVLRIELEDIEPLIGGGIWLTLARRPG